MWGFSYFYLSLPHLPGMRGHSHSRLINWLVNFTWSSIGSPPPYLHAPLISTIRSTFDSIKGLEVQLSFNSSFPIDLGPFPFNWATMDHFTIHAPLILSLLHFIILFYFFFMLGIWPIHHLFLLAHLSITTSCTP